MLQNHRWLIIIPVLLLAAMLGGRQLNTWAFAFDESSTLIAAGARDFGPHSLAEAVAAQNARAPDQAFGWSLLMNLWGRVAGWSTVAVRATAWFAGLLTLALVYGLGRCLFSHEAGVIAALLLSASVLFVSYMHIGRTFTLVTAFSTVWLWCYWRLAIDARPTARKHLAGLLLGGVGLLYTHYLAGLLLLATGLFHLIYLRRDGRWWRVTLLLALVALAAIPELAVLLRGVEKYASESVTHLTAPEVAVRLLYALSNSLVSLPQLAGAPLLLVLIVLLLRRPRHGLHAGWFPGVIALLQILLIIAVNEVVGVLRTPDRVRYFMVLWPSLALLAGHGIWQLRHRQRRLAEWLLIALFASGVTLILRSDVYQGYATYNLTFIHLADQALQQQARPDDLLLMEDRVLNAFYLENLHKPRVTFSMDSPPGPDAQEAIPRRRIWLLTAEADSAIEQGLSGEMQLCRRPVQRKGMALALYARSADDCA